MNDKQTFIDSNVWLYAFIQSDKAKHLAAKEAVRRIKSPIISSQVVSEVCVNMLKKAGRKEPFIRELISSFHSQYEVVPLTEVVLLKASRLREQYSLSYWDSMICSAALESHCDILLTEDMQHGLLIEDRLKIINPFE
jgi:predicted nucleic acid-binding protein